MNIRIYHARIITMEENKPVFEGEVHVKGNKIAYVGPALEDGKRNTWDREIDAKGNVIMPGFKNAHTHSGMTFLRSYADDMPLEDWLHKQVFPREACLTPEDVYHLSKLAILEYLTSGITANLDMYLTPDTIAKASQECGFRTVMTGGFNNFTQSVANDPNFDRISKGGAFFDSRGCSIFRICTPCKSRAGLKIYKAQIAIASCNS